MPVTAVSRYPGHIDLFHVGDDGGIYSTWWDSPNKWGEVFRIGPKAKFPTGNAVSVVSRHPDHLDLFVVGSDGGIYSTWWDSTDGWAAWFRIGTEAVPFPEGRIVSVHAPTPDHLDLFVVSAGDWLYSTQWDSTSGWASGHIYESGRIGFGEL
jgi:hypothetical protein